MSGLRSVVYVACVCVCVCARARARVCVSDSWCCSACAFCLPFCLSVRPRPPSPVEHATGVRLKSPVLPKPLEAQELLSLDDFLARNDRDDGDRGDGDLHKVGDPGVCVCVCVCV
ncbi:MAG: hypothetical protein P4L40_02595 [Terracidiphilus sp.]|nr:hypothetical protein [Terracidiphilus sp.]